MVNLEYANAYSEVLEILKYIPKEDYDKIDKELIDVFFTNHNVEYKFKYNPKKSLNEQGVSKKTKTIIAILFRDYWATDIQKQKILAKEKYDFEKEEEKKKELYTTDNLFKNKYEVMKDYEKIEVLQRNSLIKYKKENFLSRLIKRIKIFFKGKF